MVALAATGRAWLPGVAQRICGRYRGVARSKMHGPARRTFARKFLGFSRQIKPPQHAGAGQQNRSYLLEVEQLLEIIFTRFTVKVLCEPEVPPEPDVPLLGVAEPLELPPAALVSDPVIRT